MCLIIHKPAGECVPEDLLASAVQFNPHGFGVMAFGSDQRVLVRRRARGSLAVLKRLVNSFDEQECVLHLRYRTRGDIDIDNTQPLRVTSRIVMVHNGTVAIEQHTQERSDTWHLVKDYLRPLLGRRPELLYEKSFQELVRSWAGPHNRFAFMDGATRRTVIINREAGMDVGALWLSNSRWFDGSQFEWYKPRLSSETAARPLVFSL